MALQYGGAPSLQLYLCRLTDLDLQAQRLRQVDARIGRSPTSITASGAPIGAWSPCR